MLLGNGGESPPQERRSRLRATLRQHRQPLPRRSRMRPTVSNRRTRTISPLAVPHGVWALLGLLTTVLAILAVGCMLLAAVLTYFGSSSSPALSAETQSCDASAFMTL